MLIPAHVGFTFTLVVAVSKIRKVPFPTLKQLGFFAVIAILPDILDKSIHLLFRPYPDHGVFHSFFIYGLLALFLAWRKNYKTMFIILLLIFHSVLDLVSTFPGALIYPLRGFVDRTHWYAPIGEHYMKGLPSELQITIPDTTHFLVFEIIGVILIAIITTASYYESKSSKPPR